MGRASALMSSGVTKSRPDNQAHARDVRSKPYTSEDVRFTIAKQGGDCILVRGHGIDPVGVHVRLADRLEQELSEPRLSLDAFTRSGILRRSQQRQTLWDVRSPPPIGRVISCTLG